MGLLDSFHNNKITPGSSGEKPKRALAYCRVSHEDSAERSTSIETQKRDIEVYAAREGIEIVEWYLELGRSAFKDGAKRPEFQRMIQRATSDREIDLILVWKLDRFARDRYFAATIKGELAKSKVRVVSILEQFDSTTTSGVVMESIHDAMSQIRSMELGQVIFRNLLTNCEMRDPKTQCAFRNGGQAQFGYKNVRIYTDVERRYQRISRCIWQLDDQIVSGKPVFEWARTMLIDWRLKDQLGPDEIAKRLTEAGVPTPRGRKAWSDSSVNYLLMEDKLLQYAGSAIWNRRSFRNSDIPEWKDQSEWIIIENAHPAIITIEEAEAIHAIRTGRKCKPGRKGRRQSPYILTRGLLKCSNCDANYIGRMQHGIDFYTCGSQVYRHGADCPTPWYIRQDELDRAAFRCIETVLAAGPEYLNKIVEGYNSWVDSQFELYGRTETSR